MFGVCITSVLAVAQFFSMCFLASLRARDGGIVAVLTALAVLSGCTGVSVMVDNFLRDSRM